MGIHSFSSTGSSTTNFPGIINFKYDSFEVTAKTVDGPTEVQYFLGGLSGTLIATITITYDIDGDILTVVRT